MGCGCACSQNERNRVDEKIGGGCKLKKHDDASAAVDVGGTGADDLVQLSFKSGMPVCGGCDGS